MEFRVLGPLQVVEDGREVPVSGPGGAGPCFFGVCAVLWFGVGGGGGATGPGPLAWRLVAVVDALSFCPS